MGVETYTRWVKQKVKCRVNESTEEIIDIIDIIDDEMESDNYEKI